jgi:hypothetical protein
MNQFGSKKEKEHLSAKELAELAQQTLDLEAKAGQKTGEPSAVKVCKIDSLDHPKKGLRFKRETACSSNVSQLHAFKRFTPPG